MIARYKRLFKKHQTDKLLENIFNIQIRGVKFHSFFEALKWNDVFSGKSRKHYDISGNILREAITYEFKKRGGMVIFSVDVNAIIDKRGFTNKIKGFFKGKVETLINRLKKHKKLAKLLLGFEKVTSYSVGNLFRGKYFDRENEKTYNEKSLSVEIIGIPFEILIAIAEAIAREFSQKEVLVKDYNSGRIMLVDKKQA